MNLIRCKFNSDYKDKGLFSTDESPVKEIQDKNENYFKIIAAEDHDFVQEPENCENVLETTHEIFNMTKKHKRNLSFREWKEKRNMEMNKHNY